MAAVRHILLYRFKPDIPEARIDEHLAHIQSFEGKTAGLIGLKAGRNLNPHQPEYTHGFVMTFASQQALDAYNQSDEHRVLVETFRPDIEKKVVFDLNG